MSDLITELNDTDIRTQWDRPKVTNAEGDADTTDATDADATDADTTDATDADTTDATDGDADTTDA